MKFNFKRIISKGAFIPEIDGLRFIAIASVVIYHLSGFLIAKDLNKYETSYDFGLYDNLLSHGHLGVPLFFIISGFILARPFANMYLQNGREISIKQYFIRRLTRLEPPYILIMTILFVGIVYVAKRVPFDEAFISYLCSITYTHNFFYGKGYLSLVNAVTWSLEIEIQFYVLMPILAKIFTASSHIIRRGLIILAALFFIVYDFYETLPFVSILNYFEYFLIGFLLADLYVSKHRIFEKSSFDLPLSLFLFALIWMYDVKNIESTMFQIGWEIIQLTAIFFFYYLVLFHNSIKILANKIITNIGGMCYTIYLLHFTIISMLGNPLVRIPFSNNYLINTTIYSMLLLSIILMVSAIYFLLVERPCMDKDWYKKIRIKIPNVAT